MSILKYFKIFYNLDITIKKLKFLIELYKNILYFLNLLFVYLYKNIYFYFLNNLSDLYLYLFNFIKILTLINNI